MPLTDVAIRNAKADLKPSKLSDGGGLFLLITPQGSKLWRFAYRFFGKQKTLALGSYPDVSAADARRQRDAARKFISDGLDPSVQRKIEKQANGNTFRVVAQELLDKMRREGRADATLAKTEWLLEFALPVLGDRPAAKISAVELLAVLRKIEGRGKYETARRLRSTCGMVFRYAISTGRAERDPTVDLRGALTTPKVTYIPMARGFVYLIASVAPSRMYVSLIVPGYKISGADLTACYFPHPIGISSSDPARGPSPGGLNQ